LLNTREIYHNIYIRNRKDIFVASAADYGDIFDRLEKALTQMFTQHSEQFNKQIQPLTTLWNNSFSQLPNVVEQTVKQLSERTIQIKTPQGTSLYTTEISNTGDLINNFPDKPPDPNDVYWIRHNQLVDRYLTDKQTTIDKVIGIIGDTAKGVLNPISSISFAPADLIKVIEELRK
jgi:hypothetical protein